MTESQNSNTKAPILVIDDDPAQLQTIADILETEDMRPICCQSGAAALTACRHEEVNVVILDLRLPDTDGLELLKRLKEHNAGLKAIINTAYPTLESAVTAVNEEAFAYVTKMGDVEELLAHVHRAFHYHFEQYSEELERQVSERTDDLLRANEELKTEVAERKRAEEAIKAGLREKEILLREIHHRVKNNLQIVSSLLRIQSKYIKDKEALAIFKESEGRIRSMALIHQNLYKSDDLADIDFFGYVEVLAKDLLKSYGVDTGEITLTINVENIVLDVHAAVPCGLVINELISNCLKHAFGGWRLSSITESAAAARSTAAAKDVKHPQIMVAVCRKTGDQIELIVKDNGSGLPEDLNLDKPTTLGFQLVRSLVEIQLAGEIEFNGRDGTEVIIRFLENPGESQ